MSQRDKHSLVWKETIGERWPSDCVAPHHDSWPRVTITAATRPLGSALKRGTDCKGCFTKAPRTPCCIDELWPPYPSWHNDTCHQSKECSQGLLKTFQPGLAPWTMDVANFNWFLQSEYLMMRILGEGYYRIIALWMHAWNKTLTFICDKNRYPNVYSVSFSKLFLFCAHLHIFDFFFLKHHAEIFNAFEISSFSFAHFCHLLIFFQTSKSCRSEVTAHFLNSRQEE